METSTLADTPRSDAHLDTAGTTHVGYVRSRNEDDLLVSRERGLFVVADGLGGHPAGDVASRMAVATLDELDGDALANDPATQLEDALHEAHAAISEAGQRNPEQQGMGTTAVAAWTDGQRMVLASVGDSRAYRLRDGALQQVTTDDVWEAAFGRTLTQALGGSEQITPEIVELDLDPGDRILLCTDGLTDMVDDDLIADVLGEPLTAEHIGDRLTASALDHGGYDNITVVVLLTAD